MTINYLYTLTTYKMGVTQNMLIILICTTPYDCNDAHQARNLINCYHNIKFATGI